MRLGAHPDLRSRIESQIFSVEDETGYLKTADAAGICVMEMKRPAGRDGLQSQSR